MLNKVGLLFIFIYYFWLRWVFVAALGLSLVAARGAILRCSAWASHCGGFSLQTLGSRRAGFGSCSTPGSVVAARGPYSTWASVVVAHGLSSCGAWGSRVRGLQ